MKVATEGKEELCWISSRDREQSLSLHHTHNNKRRQGGALKIRSGRKKPKLIKENREIKVMAVAVSRDLTVQVLEDVNAVKLTERQQALRTAVLRGEPKCLGVSQVMLGLMVMSYSIPLHFTEVTEVVSLGVPWWSGLTLWACLMVSVVSTVLSVVAVIIYSVDMDKNSEVPCVETLHGDCSEIHYTTQMLSMGVKSSLLLFTLAQTAISAILCFLLFRHRRCYRQYASLTKAAPSTPTALIPPDLN
ncbi:transmembrane protein 176 isoform X3 [Siniperca chuatsi]|uniref:transmembrane protein 176 isoform X3 n=1 Tax=Siniperca chuatsi TaxID=119488 RepID=UPI001CE2224F|nr:transmembrane protein 176 isoform X3 [Siniperca chuatsi]